MSLGMRITTHGKKKYVEKYGSYQDFLSVIGYLVYVRFNAHGFVVSLLA
jgi:hypothetical protein